MERQSEGPNSEHHLPSTNKTPFSPCTFFALLLILISQECPFHLWAWGRGYLRPKASNVATESKAFMPVARQGAGIYFPHPPVSSLRPLAPPRSLKEIHCPCFLSCLPLPELGKQYSTKQKKGTSCAFVCCAGQKCCLLHSTAWILLPHIWTLW